MSTIFTTQSGKEYDLRLDFFLARKLSQWDFSKISPTPFHIMVPTKTAFNELYYDLGLLGAIAFAIVWERKKLEAPEGDFSPEAQTAAELEFTRELDGETMEALQTALWEAFCDFFRKLAGDLRKISLAQKTAAEESEKLNAQIVETIQKTAALQMESLQKKLKNAGDLSGEWPVSSDGAGTT